MNDEQSDEDDDSQTNLEEEEKQLMAIEENKTLEDANEHFIKTFITENMNKDAGKAWTLHVMHIP